MLFNPANLPYWILLGIGVLLFLFVIVSGGGNEDVDIDADVDVDADADLDADADGEFSFGQVLGWAGIGKAPLILLLATDFSLWGLLGWILNVWLGSIFNGIVSGFLASIVLFGSLILSLFSGGLIARPIGKIFAEFGEDATSDRLIGCTGIVSSKFIPTENENRIGQVDVIDPSRNLMTVNAIVPQWATIVPRRGDKVIVIERKSDIYSIIVKESPDQERWMETSR
jgi:Protein of unknown function (DUF1449)